MPIHTGMKTIRIPHASNKRWLTLFYAMPRELVGKVQTYLDFPRCPYEVLRTDKYDRLINDDMFLELIWDCTAWAAWQYIEVPYVKGGYREIPGSMLNYSGDFPIWQLCYHMLPLIMKKMEENGFSFQSLANMPRGMEVPWLTYRQFGNLIGGLVPMIIEEQNWQPLIDEAWRNRTLEDYSEYESRVKIDFQRAWTHSRTKAGASLSLDEAQEQKDGGIEEIADPRGDFEDGLIQKLRLMDFMETLEERDQQILSLKMQGQTNEEIAKAVGYETHSAVTKRLQRIGEKYKEYMRREYDGYRETF